MKMTNKCNLNRGGPGLYFTNACPWEASIGDKWQLQSMWIHVVLRPTSVIALHQALSALIHQAALLWNAESYRWCPFKKTHLHVYQFQEIIFAVVQQVMVTLGYRKRQDQNTWTSTEQCVSSPPPQELKL